MQSMVAHQFPPLQSEILPQQNSELQKESHLDQLPIKTNKTVNSSSGEIWNAAFVHTMQQQKRLLQASNLMNTYVISRQDLNSRFLQGTVAAHRHNWVYFNQNMTLPSPKPTNVQLIFSYHNQGICQIAPQSAGLFTDLTDDDIKISVLIGRRCCDVTVTRSLCARGSVSKQIPAFMSKSGKADAKKDLSASRNNVGIEPRSCDS